MRVVKFASALAGVLGAFVLVPAGVDIAPSGQAAEKGESPPAANGEQRKRVEDLATSASERFGDLVDGKGQPVRAPEGKGSPAGGFVEQIHDWVAWSSHHYQGLMRGLAAPPMYNPVAQAAREQARVQAGLLDTGISWIHQSSTHYQEIVRGLADPSMRPVHVYLKEANDVARAEEASRAVEAQKAAEAKRGDEARIAAAKQAEDTRRAEEANRAAEVQKAAEAKRGEDARRAAEAQKAAEAKRAEETRTAAAKQAEDARRAEETSRAAEVQKAAEAKQAEEARVAAAKQAEEARRTEEVRRAAEAQKAAEAKRAEEVRVAAAAKQAEDARRSEDTRQAAEAQKAADAKKEEEARVAAAGKRPADVRGREPPQEDANSPPKKPPKKMSKKRATRKERTARSGAPRKVAVAASHKRVKVGKGHRWKKKPAERACPMAGVKVDTPSWYVVKKGDTLWEIASRHYLKGRRYRLIYRANARRLNYSTRLELCQRLYLPRFRRSN